MKTSTVTKIDLNLLLDLNLPRRYTSRHIWDDVSIEVYLRKQGLPWMWAEPCYGLESHSVEGKMEEANWAPAILTLGFLIVTAMWSAAVCCCSSSPHPQCTASHVLQVKMNRSSLTLLFSGYLIRAAKKKQLGRQWFLLYSTDVHM